MRGVTKGGFGFKVEGSLCCSAIMKAFRNVIRWFGGGLVVAGLASAGPREGEWKKAEEAREKDQPKTAIELLGEIEKAAFADRAWAEGARALAGRIALEAKIEGEAAPIMRLGAEIGAAPEEVRPVLRALEARWMAGYYRQNRWDFAHRSTLGEAAGDDITTWDLARILSEVDRRFQQALADGEALKEIPVADFAELLEEGELGDGLRPTLYDFVAHAALEFYGREEVVVSRPVDSFGIAADSPVFGTAEEFLAWRPEVADEASPKARAFEIFRGLLEFHGDDEERDAFLMADLERLRWAGWTADAEGREERFERALRRFIEAHGASPVSAWARVDLGRLLLEREETKEAHAVLREGAETFAEHPFGKLCGNGVSELEARELSLAAESHWTPASEEILVTHRNLKRVWFRLYPAPFAPGAAALGDDPFPESEQHLEALLRGEPVRACESELVDEGDFRRRMARLEAPADLSAGYHVLIASGDAAFAVEDNALAIMGIHVTPLAMTVRAANGRFEGFVVDAVNGAPQAGVEVGVWVRRERPPGADKFTVRTDADGRFEIAGKVDDSFLAVAQRGVERAVARGWAGVNLGRDPEVRSTVAFFTDRAIYRPGQTVHFKGIWCEADPAGGNYRTLANRSGTVVLRDPNRKETARMVVTTNGRGSFSGTFTAPEGGVLGICTLAMEGERGEEMFRVEEYKRPKFFVEADAPGEPAALGKTVRVKVRAGSYTGAPVDGAKVEWRVSRTTRLPWWPRWTGWGGIASGDTREIAHGTAETDAEGMVWIEFVAEADVSVREDAEPVFNFLVTADVTDGSGETRTAMRRVSVAYTALHAGLDTDVWLEAGKEIELKVSTASHDDEGRPASGMLKIHRLKEPETCPRPGREDSVEWEDSALPSADPDDWEAGELVAELPVETDDKGKAVVKRSLEAGAYRLVFETKDANGRAVRAMSGIQVVAPGAEDFPTMIPFYTAIRADVVEPGGEAAFLWGSGYEIARACVEWSRDGKVLKREWSEQGRTQQLFRFPVGEEHRGGITATVWQVAMNRLHQCDEGVEVPWTNKKLTLRWEHLVSKLEPGAKETWTAVIEGEGSEAVAAEMVATLYDASLDAFVSHGFQSLGWLLRRENSRYDEWELSGAVEDFEEVSEFAVPEGFDWRVPFRSFRDELEIFGDGGAAGGVPWRTRSLYVSDEGLGAPMAMSVGESFSITSGNRSGDGAVTRNSIDAILNNPARMQGNQPAYRASSDFIGLPQAGAAAVEVAARANLQEIAFFFPDLTSDAEGKVRITFTMPEALTKWRFLGLAHDAEMRSGLLEGETVTAKDLMVQPNPPRFLREGDELWFTVKITNVSDKEQSGTARLTLADAATEEDRTAALGIDAPEQPFTVPGKESRTLKWRIAVPDGAGFLSYKAVASGDDLSDSEEGWLPVIPRRIPVTESLSLPVRDAGATEFDFERLSQSGGSETLENRFLHVQVVSQPAWYAVMALPYLMEFPHECSEQTFNRYYANALARHIAGSDPRIRRIFDRWKADGKTLDSPLQKNADLKGIMLEETPWLREASDESEARRRVGLLFDDNHMERELEKALAKLQAAQRGDGLWPWFPGGPGDSYISLYVATGFARLRELGVETDVTPALKALEALDGELARRHEELRRDKRFDGENLDERTAHYLYTRTFFLKDKALKAEHKAAFDYFAEQARKHWAKLGSRMSRAHAALALHRLGDGETPALITRSLKEHAIVSGEQGMSWKEEAGWWWWQAPIETQAMMIEAFREIDGDEKAVEDCQVWLVRQKQVQDWKTTKATADAVYALLRGGRDLLGSDARLKVSLGGREVKPEAVEAGTGFYESRIAGEAVTPDLGKIELVKTDAGAAWASVHWQYFEDMAKIGAHGQEALTLEKSLFVRRNTDRGPVLVPLDGAAKVGDELVTRVVLRNDRAMEYVHLKDMRGSGTEPVNVLSGYRWQDGFGYYEVTRDTASHFFIDRLPAGTHVFETSVRVQHAGKYQAGIAEIRCMYAPEFNARSGSVEVVVE